MMRLATLAAIDRHCYGALLTSLKR